MNDYENAVEIKGLTKRYDGFTLDNVSFDVPKGSIMGFIGQNGAGKTTTINALLNIVKKDEGEIKLEKDIAYLEYTSKETGDKVSTKEAEKAAAELAAESTTEAVSEVNPDANNNIDAQYVDEPVYTQPAYEEPVYTQAPYVEPTTVYVAPTEAQVPVEVTTGCGDFQTY